MDLLIGMPMAHFVIRSMLLKGQVPQPRAPPPVPAAAGGGSGSGGGGEAGAHCAGCGKAEGRLRSCARCKSLEYCR